MKWINLEKYGAELKRVELSNGTKFPAIIITDVAKYHSSGATPLATLKQENNRTGFEKLGGNKGRNVAHPVFFLTNTYSEGKRGVFNIYDNLAKLLNISRDELVNTLVTENIPNSDIILKEGFIDPNFHKIVQNNAQEHYNRTIFVPKVQDRVVSLPELEKALLQKQHGLFPKANVGRIPLSTLDKFGYDSSIVSKGFLSTEDAFKAGYKLHDLDSITLQGDIAILPLSINKDSSVNFINNVGAVPQLSYSNLEWKTNLNLIKDFEAVVSTRELCRDVLNTKASEIAHPELMESHLERLSSAFQKCYQLGNNISTAKLMKYENDKTFTFISKNADNEWRYIEMNFSNKEDKPLNEENFKRAIETLAKNSLVISSALSLSAPQGADLQRSLDTVLKNQLHSFVKFAKMDAKAAIPTLNEDGKKIHKSTFDKEVREIQPNRGETLYEKQVVSFLNSGEAQTDVSNIVGSGRPLTESEMEAQLEASTQATRKPAQSVFNDAALNFLDDDALAQEIIENAPSTDAKPVAPTIEQYLNLPKGLNGVTAENYDAINQTYKAVQYLEVVALPKLHQALGEQQSKLKHVTDQVLNNIAAKTTTLLNNQVTDAAKLNDAMRIPDNLRNMQKDLSTGVTYFEDRIAVEQVKLNLLTYRLETKIGKAPEASDSLSVINVTAEGNARPFADTAELETAKQAIYSHQVLTLPQDQYGIPTLVEANRVLEEAATFVNDNYAKAEPQKFTLYSDVSVEPEQLAVQPHRYILNVQPVSADFKQGVDKNIALALINNSPTLMLDNLPSYDNKARLGTYLDSVLSNMNAELSKVSNVTKIDSFNDPKFKAVMSAVSQNETNPLDPNTNLQIGSIAKLRLISDVALKSLNDLTAQDDIGSVTLGRTGLLTLRDLHEQVTADIANSTQELNRQAYGSFLLARQSPNALVKESSQVWGMYGKDHPQAFRVNAYERNSIPDGVIALSSPSYSSAVNESYNQYQFSALSSSFGLQQSEVEALNSIAALSGQDANKANELLQAFTAQPTITLNNFMSFDAKTAQDLKIPAPEATDLFVKLSMLGKVMNIDTKTPFSDLTNESSKDHNVSIQNLLQPNNSDLKQAISNILANDSGDKITKAANQIIVDAVENNPFANNPDVQLTVFGAEHKNDVAFARFIPTSWTTLDANAANKQYLIAKPDAPDVSALTGQLAAILRGTDGFAPSLLVDTKLTSTSVPEPVLKHQFSNNASMQWSGSYQEELLKVKLLENAIQSMDSSVKTALPENPGQLFNIVTEYNDPKSENYPAVRIQPHAQAIDHGQTIISQVNSQTLAQLIQLDQEKLEQATSLLNAYSQVAGVTNEDAQYKIQNPSVESHADFKTKFDDLEPININQHLDRYADLIVAASLDAFANNPNETKLHLVFDQTESELPRFELLTTDQVQGNSSFLTINANDHQTHNKVWFAMESEQNNVFYPNPDQKPLNIIPAAAFINASESVILNKAEIETASVNDIYNALGDRLDNANPSAPDKFLNKSGVFARTDGENFEFKLSGSAEHAAKLSQDGFVGLGDSSYSGSSSNYLSQFNTNNFDRDIKKGLTSQPGMLAPENQIIQTPQTAPALISEVKAHPEPVQNIVATIKHFTPIIKADDVLTMKPSQIVQDVNLDAAWKQPKFEDTASPDSKTLDAAVLAQMVYHSFPKTIPMNPEIGIERNANVYLYAINETQRALLNSNDLSSTVKALSGVNSKLNTYAPTHFTDIKPEEKVFKELLNTVAKIEKSSVLAPNLAEALNSSISESTNLSTLRNIVAQELIEAHKVNSPELQATIAAQVPNALTKSLDVQPTSSSSDLGEQNKWGYKLNNSKSEMNVVKLAVINEAFNQLHNSLGGAESGIKPSDLGKNITINLDAQTKETASEISIGKSVPKVADVYKEIKNTFINNTVNKIVENEAKISGISPDIVSSPSYQAQTSQMQTLVNMSKGSVVEGDKTTAEKLVAYSKALFEQNKTELQKADKSNPAVEYVVSQTNKLMDRQNKLLSQFDSKAEKLGQKPNVEMLDYMMLSDSVNKVSNATINSSEKEITAYFSKQIQDKQLLSKTVKHVQSALNSNSDVYTAAHDVLNSNAVHQALTSIVQHMPDAMKSDDNFLNSFKEGFSANFGQHSNVSYKELEVNEPNAHKTQTLSANLVNQLENVKDNTMLLNLAKLGSSLNSNLEDDIQLKKQLVNTLQPNNQM